MSADCSTDKKKAPKELTLKKPAAGATEMFTVLAPFIKETSMSRPPMPQRTDEKARHREECSTRTAGQADHMESVGHRRKCEEDKSKAFIVIGGQRALANYQFYVTFWMNTCSLVVFTVSPCAAPGTVKLWETHLIAPVKY